MQRVMIVGGPGSGKSTLARLLGDKTSLPVYHMDLIHWKPGWVERGKAEKLVLAREVEARERWIFEGGLSTTYAERAMRADTLIWLDFPLWRRYVRVIWRTLKQRGKTRPDLPENCPERFDREFLHFIWRTRQSSRRSVIALIEKPYPHLDVHILRSLTEVRAFLHGIDQAAIGTESSA
ncbi:MAG: DNA topology modulation protein FlaR [Pseudomonadota bacterium]